MGRHVPGESEKPVVFSHLFEHRYDPTTSTFTPSTVTNAEIQEAIVTLRGDEGLSLSVGNPANFLKDFLRSWSRNALWPEDVAAAGYSARQAYGSGAVFDFVPYLPGQTEPFPYEYDLPASAPLHRIESVSLPSAARALGREDEPWLIQVAVHQRVLPTHFALFSDLDAVDLFHLQNTIKGTPEIDAVFLLTFREGGTLRKALVTMEAKRNEPILPDQIKSQIAYMAKQCRVRPGLSDVEFIVPVAAATRKPSRRLGIFEMRHISVADGVTAHDAKAAHTLPLVISKVVGYDFFPPVSGI
ncbi:hypothetical protein [Methylobacterium sp. WL19]|uniref:hypothetical protein n=1 Tax=Methylobacterium sp. WL19 TaxID=2603896 RepID=UPI0011C7E3EE|nr:hypothetical protein [Methylobacterium sp. WL19]TXN22674.1 hypothetical protein FV220_21810 [Methylobacterium sp. WL19]